METRRLNRANRGSRSHGHVRLCLREYRSHNDTSTRRQGLDWIICRSHSSVDGIKPETSNTLRAGGGARRIYPRSRSYMVLLRKLGAVVRTRREFLGTSLGPSSLVKGWAEMIIIGFLTVALIGNAGFRSFLGRLVSGGPSSSVVQV